MDSQNLNKSHPTAVSRPKKARGNPFVWANIALIAAVPWLVVESMAGLAVGDPVFSEWFEISLLGIPAIALATWQQWQQPIYPFSLWFVTKPQGTLNDRELKILTLVKQRRNGWYATGLIAVSVAGLMLFLFSKIYGAAPLAEAIAPFPSGLRLLGIIWAEAFWVASNFVLQSGIAALRIQLTAETELNSLQPISVEKVKNSFTIIGWRSPQILRFLDNSEEQSDISQSQEVNKPEDTSQIILNQSEVKDIVEVNSEFQNADAKESTFEEVAIAFAVNSESFDTEVNVPELNNDIEEILGVEPLDDKQELTEEVLEEFNTLEIQEIAINEIVSVAEETSIVNFTDIAEEVFTDNAENVEIEANILEFSNDVEEILVVESFGDEFEITEELLDLHTSEVQELAIVEIVDVAEEPSIVNVTDIAREVAIAFTDNVESFDAESDSLELIDNPEEILSVESADNELEITEEILEFNTPQVQELAIAKIVDVAEEPSIVNITDIVEEISEEFSTFEESNAEILEITSDVIVNYDESNPIVSEFLDAVDDEVSVTENLEGNEESEADYPEPIAIFNEVSTSESIYNVTAIESLEVQLFDLNDQDLSFTDEAIAKSEDTLQPEILESEKLPEQYESEESKEEVIDQQINVPEDTFNTSSSVKKENSFLQKNNKFSISKKKKKGFGKPVKIDPLISTEPKVNLSNQEENDTAPSCLIPETLLDQFLEKIEEINKSDRDIQKIECDPVVSSESTSIVSTENDTDEFADLEELLDRKFLPNEVEE